MNNIVIVEDKLERAISLAHQFVEFSYKHPELDIVVSDICYFSANTEEASRNLQNHVESQFNIKHVTLLNFSRIMDEYIYSKENRNFLIMDYILEDDGSLGIPTQRVNIRYAKNKDRYKTNQLWFYTATGTVNEQVLSTLVQKEHVLDVLRVDDNDLALCLENQDFISALAGNQTIEV